MARDYYEVLGVERTIDAPGLKAAYRKLAMVHHPDRNGGSEDSMAKFKEISEAYSVLSDDQKSHVAQVLETDAELMSATALEDRLTGESPEVEHRAKYEIEVDPPGVDVSVTSAVVVPAPISVTPSTTTLEIS